MTVTVALHAAALCTVAVIGVWKVDELEMPALGVILHQPQLQWPSGCHRQWRRRTAGRR